MNGFSYFPHTQEDIRSMLQRVGVTSLDGLYADVPDGYIHKDEYELPSALSEQQVRDFFAGLASRNTTLKVFAGGGAYDHYSPSVPAYLCSRSEFSTAYTPYQAEISQGTLRYIFEFQSYICELTGLDVANASMYDGPTAAAESMFMCLASTRKKTRFLLSESLLPNVREVVGTYAKYHGIKLTTLPLEDGQTSLKALEAELAAGDVAGVLLPLVNRFGIVEDYSGFADAIHGAKALAVAYCDPSALAVVKTPGEWDFDIAVGDGQSLGIPLNFGGPYVGFMSCRKDYLRKLPGRIVGQTKDSQGRRCFVLTLQAREQHIRREKATSNICSNQSLMALYVTIYLSLMGPEGLKEVNRQSYAGAHCLHSALLETGLFEEAFDKPFLKEFTLRTKLSPSLLQEKLLAGGFFAALEVGDGLVSFCVTEKHSKAEIDELVKIVREAAL